MIKLFNKLMYYFGYAPIKVRHEVKYHFVQREIKFDKLQKEISIHENEFINLHYSDKFILENVKAKLINKLIDKSDVYINLTTTEDPLRQMIHLRATLIVGKV